MIFPNSKTESTLKLFKQVFDHVGVFFISFDFFLPSPRRGQLVSYPNQCGVEADKHPKPIIDIPDFLDQMFLKLLSMIFCFDACL